MTDFQTWWRDIGSGINPLRREDHAEHTERVARAAWNDSRSVSVKALQDIKKHMETIAPKNHKMLSSWQIANKSLEEMK